MHRYQEMTTSYKPRLCPSWFSLYSQGRFRSRGSTFHMWRQAPRTRDRRDFSFIVAPFFFARLLRTWVRCVLHSTRLDRQLSTTCGALSYAREPPSIGLAPTWSIHASPSAELPVPKAVAPDQLRPDRA